MTRDELMRILAQEEQDPMHRNQAGWANALLPRVRGMQPNTPYVPNGTPTAPPPAPGAPAPEEEPEPYDFTGSPGYEFRFDQGRQAVENSLIGRGTGLSGRAAKELTRFGQDYGAAEFSNEFARNATLAGLQAPALNNLNALTANYGAGAANIYGNMGNAGASAYMNQGQAWNNAIQGGLSNYLFYDMFGGQGG